MTRGAIATASQACERWRDSVSKCLDDGGWVPIDKAGVSALPKNRPYSEVEAMYSLSVDRDAGRQKSEREYERIWHWSRHRVRAFLRRLHEVGGSTKVRPGAAPRKFTYVAPLRRSEHQQQHHFPTTTLNPRSQDPSERHVARKEPRASERKPWAGLSSDLDALLASDAYVQHLVAISPVLAQWTYSEIRAWARAVVAKGNAKRATRRERPIRSFPHYLAASVDRVKPYERPKEREQVNHAQIDEMLQGMRV